MTKLTRFQVHDIEYRMREKLMFGKSISTVKHWMTRDGFICRFDAGDLPLLVAIAGTHSPHLSLGVV